MTPVELKMYWAVREEASLLELAVEERMLVRDGVDVISAEDPHECSRVLLEWCDQGLVTLMRADDEVELDVPLARALLAEPASWTDDHVVVATEAGVLALLG